MLGGFPSAATFWTTYTASQGVLLPLLSDNLSFVANGVAGSVAGCAASAVRNPFEVVKQQMQVGLHSTTSAFVVSPYVSTLVVADGQIPHTHTHSDPLCIQHFQAMRCALSYELMACEGFTLALVLRVRGRVHAEGYLPRKSRPQSQSYAAPSPSTLRSCARRSF